MNTLPVSKKRRSVLYIPGNTPSMIQQGGIYGSDAILLDLEDAVTPTQKDAARILVRNMIMSVDFYSTEVMVRVNSLDTPFGIDDLNTIVPLQPDAIRIPKVSTKENVVDVLKIVEDIEDRLGLPHDKMKIHPMIETALGIENSFEVAGVSTRIDAITLGGQDLSADMGIILSKDAEAINYARRRLVMAAKSHYIDALDTVYTDVENEEGLREETIYIKKIGFTGKSLINPRQIDIVHEVFTPTEAEISQAYRVIYEYKIHQEIGEGVFAIDGKMVDAPVVARARRILKLADSSINI